MKIPYVNVDKNNISGTLEKLCINMLRLQQIVSICTFICGSACCFYNIYTQIKEKSNHK